MPSDLQACSETRLVEPPKPPHSATHSPCVL